MSNESVLASTAQAAVAQAGGTLQLDLSRLRFLSTAGSRVLAEQTRPFRDRGGRLVLIAPRDGVAQILLSGLDQLPNVDLIDGWRGELPGPGGRPARQAPRSGHARPRSAGRAAGGRPPASR